jgi:hypothetical protein
LFPGLNINAAHLLTIPLTKQPELGRITRRLGQAEVTEAVHGDEPSARGAL